MWLDNFSKIYACNVQGIDVGAFKDCLWTGIAAHQYFGPPVNLALCAAMPGSPLTAMNDQDSARLSLAMKRFDASSPLRHATSVCVRFGVNRVPLKPVVSIDSDRKLHKYLQESRDGMRHFHPVRIATDNIGSNAGLLRLLRKMSEDHQSAPVCDRKRVFLAVDINIYWRIMKVSCCINFCLMICCLYLLFPILVVPL
jgi:hypothetical protein